jgi:hypothetical protein
MKHVAEYKARRLALLLSFLAVPLLVLAALSKALLSGDDGLTLQRTAVQHVRVVTSVRAPATSAGVRLGDTIDDRDVAPVAGGSLLSMTPERFNVRRNGRLIAVTIYPEHANFDWNKRLRFAGDFWLLAFAALIAWRGKEAAGSGSLALILVVDVFAEIFGNSHVPWISLALISHAIGLLILAAGTIVLLARYFAGIGPRPSGARLWWTRATYALTALPVAILIAQYVTLAFGSNPVPLEYLELMLTAPIIPCFVCGVLAVRESQGADRQRTGWVVASYGLFWSFWLLAGPAGALWSAATGTLFWALEDVAHLFVPLGLSYATLRGRLFDIGFVINRAAVFAIVSSFVIGSFVILEWALGKWFENTGHTTSIVLNAGLALLLGLSMRFLHSRIDQFVDNVFFRRRHENESALRRFAGEAVLITDRNVLLERTRSEIRSRTEASNVEIVLRECLDENDPAVLAMRTWCEPIELRRYRTALRGEYAFPMLAHGDLTGVMLCGAKSNAELYAPDEIQALKELARGVAFALWTLDTTHGKGAALHGILERILVAQEQIVAELRALHAPNESHSA